MSVACDTKWKHSPEFYIKHMLIHSQWTKEMLAPLMYDPTNTELMLRKAAFGPKYVSKLLWIYRQDELIGIYESMPALVQDFWLGKIVLRPDDKVLNAPNPTTLLRDFLCWVNDLVVIPSTI